MRRARYLHDLGREDDARKERGLAEACQPTRPLDFFLLGDDLQRREKLPEAIRAFEDALALRGNDFWARYFLAIGHLRLGGPGHIQIARAHLDACINQQPDFVYAYILRGYARGQLQEFTAAAGDFDEALNRNPNDDATYTILVNRGVFGTRQGQFEEAAAHLEHAIALKPDRYQAYANLANVYQGKKDLVAAVKEVDRALEVAGRQARAKQVTPSVLAPIHRNRASLRCGVAMRRPRSRRWTSPSSWPPGREITPSAAASCSTRNATRKPRRPTRPRCGSGLLTRRPTAVVPKPSWS